MAKPKQEESLRVAGYCRTSSEGQRDNTSIPTQKEHIARKVTVRGWTLVRHYVDESKSGSKIDGRDEFQRMMRDAANGEFDVIVVYDLSRFGRNGADIIECARKLKTECNVDLVETSGGFDNSDDLRIVSNFTLAGVTEYIRRLILKNTINGRIARAREGKPWSAKPPVGRSFDKRAGSWFVNDKGKAIAQALQRYVDGESLTELCTELGLGDRKKISQWVHHGQLTDTYVAEFRSPDIGISEDVEIAAIPNVITARLLAQVKKRLTHNRTFNRSDVRKYVLSGFIRCACCGKALSAQTQDGHVYYRHKATEECRLTSVRGSAVENQILKFLYEQFLDEPAFNEAVQKALPSAEERKTLEANYRRTHKRLFAIKKEIDNLATAIAKGASPAMLISVQYKLESEQKTLWTRLEELADQLSNMPSVEQTIWAATQLRFRLRQEFTGRDWKSLPYDEVKRFLLNLFGEAKASSPHGAFVDRDENGRLVVTFRGNIEFGHSLMGGRPISDYLATTVRRMNKDAGRRYEQDVALAKRQRELDEAAAAEELRRAEEYFLKPSPVSSSIGADEVDKRIGRWPGDRFRTPIRSSCGLRPPGLQAIRATQS